STYLSKQILLKNIDDSVQIDKPSRDELASAYSDHHENIHPT
ncbi:20204_t:CDS:1, partial [Gigaspora rosea]